MRHIGTMILMLTAGLAAAFSQDAKPAAAVTPAPPQPSAAMMAAARVVSPEVMADRTIVFRIMAPEAKTVALRAYDIPNLPKDGPVFTKNEDGVWSTTVGPVDPGAYRYVFAIDGVSANDPRNPAISESNTNTWSLVYVPGAEFMDTQKVPHGAVAAITYYSTALGKFRRMHIYTPPGYEAGQREVSGVLSAARFGRLRRGVDIGRPRGLHPRQHDCGEEGGTDDRGDAGGTYDNRSHDAGRAAAHAR